eukprot:TRINITY_DN131_c0_g1_i2.p1 TRINITY_DN131_c0_g1~~TRINITY_DN131_c0_g1_i2.p1  ORF type:complete len:280 (+),score=80.20 TRINITY_DN131_c0_g1_i2:83-922(+)
MGIKDSNLRKGRTAMFKAEDQTTECKSLLAAGTTMGPIESQLMRARRSLKPKKANKALPTSVRAGDWICLMCNNLNFSFRNECNRCQVQTKKQNHLQNLMLINDPNYQPRKPLENITNKEFGELRSPGEAASGKENIRPGKPLGLGRSGKNKGFENALFITPPRLTNLDLATPSNERPKANPYRPPAKLPSVSPFVRKLLVGEVCFPQIEPFSIDDDEGSGNEGGSDENAFAVLELSQRLNLDDSDENFEEIQRSINEMVFCHGDVRVEQKPQSLGASQ